jgi:proteasome lid subunit RPN8/RPN11
MNPQHATRTPSVPASTENANTIAADAAALTAYLRAFRVRFDYERKVKEAVDFSTEAGGCSLALPTKAEGTAAHKANLALFASGLAGTVRLRRLAARVVADDRKGKDGRSRVALHVDGYRLGFVQDKHARWLLPLLQTDERGAVSGCIEFFALQVTGGTEEKPTRGLNFCITGVGARLRSPEAPAPVGANHYAAEDAAEKAEDGEQTEGDDYRSRIFSGVPLFTTRLVSEGAFPFEEREQLRSPDDVARLLAAYFSDRDREEFVVVLLDAANTVTGLVVVSVGGLSASIVEPRAVFKAAILANAAAVVCVHNHPSGNPEPSREDVQITKQLVEAGKLMGVPVHDHLVIAGRAYTSLAERGLC